jgi:hypothetical protein
VTEIAVWALFYLWEGCLPDATEDALRILKKYAN